MLDNNIPDVKATKTTVGRGKSLVILLHITCPYCGKAHTHGGGSNLDSILYGHRLSHCGGNNPGYNLVPAGD